MKEILTCAGGLCRSDISVVAITTVADEAANCIDTGVTGNVRETTLVNVYNKQSLQVRRHVSQVSLPGVTFHRAHSNQSLQVRCHVSQVSLPGVTFDRAHSNQSLQVRCHVSQVSQPGVTFDRARSSVSTTRFSQGRNPRQTSKLNFT